MKKICFAIPVHENKEVIIELLENIRYFCLNTSVVLFQSGTDPDLCKGLGYPVCPTSFPMQWGHSFQWFFLNIMEWLEQIQHPYDYLVNIDSDALFAKRGFETFILSEMQGIDYMATHLRLPEDNWDPAITMRKVWPLWQPIFNRDHFLACFMGAQIFSRNFVKQILHFDKYEEMKSVMKQTDVFALEEILFPTLAEAFGIQFKRYPPHVEQWIRFRPHYMREEVEAAINSNQDCYLIHPVHRNMNDPVRHFVKSLLHPQSP